MTLIPYKLSWATFLGKISKGWRNLYKIGNKLAVKPKDQEMTSIVFGLGSRCVSGDLDLVGIWFLKLLIANHMNRAFDCVEAQLTLTWFCR